MLKEWGVEFTIEGKTSFFCDTEEEAKKMARDYLLEIYQGLPSDCSLTATKLRTCITVQKSEPQESKGYGIGMFYL